MTKSVVKQAAAAVDCAKRHVSRDVPFIRNVKIRTVIGLVLLVLSIAISTKFHGGDQFVIMALIAAFAWLPAVMLTEKYIHKYPQRYFTYLIASHLKSAIVMAFFIWVLGMVADLVAASQDILWTGYIIFVLSDALASVPYRRDIPGGRYFAKDAPHSKAGVKENRSGNSDTADAVTLLIDTQAIIKKIHPDLDSAFVEFIGKNLSGHQGGATDVLVLDDIANSEDQPGPAPVGLLVGSLRLNDVRRLNRFLMFCAQRIAMGGYIALRYMPLENVTEKMRQCYAGPVYWAVFISHYIWYRAIPKIPLLDKLYFSPIFSWLDTIRLSIVKKRNRTLAKAEVWGRLAFCGMHVVAESKGDDELYIIAKKVAHPVQNKIPSYYPVVGLEKVGLDGEIIRLHKVRTMFPFREFLQKRIFEDNGLASTGKFANDYRLTEFGKLLRKYWLDELPQLFDWLRGDIKLVGMRATSRHFLSLYPQELYDLYIQIKPGLVPPIFNESTGGFEKIVEVEMAYLKSYWEQPFRTDVRYLIQTFTDIVFKGVRSK